MEMYDEVVPFTEEDMRQAQRVLAKKDARISNLGKIFNEILSNECPKYRENDVSVFVFCTFDAGHAVVRATYDGEVGIYMNPQLTWEDCNCDE